MSTLCSNCGFENPPGMRFCGNCGSRLSESVTSPTSSTISAPTTNNLRERFQQAGLEAAGQRRNVTVLFADLSGYTALSERLDTEDVYYIIQEYLKLLTDIVYRYDGFVDKYTGDGLMALFGAPIMQESNAELAVRAASDMQTELARLSSRLTGRSKVDLYMRIGLNAGSVVVGGVGSDLQMNYTAIGDTVNLASRLEQAARPGSILVSESVYRSTQMLFEYARQPLLSLKGISNPVQSYQYIGVKERPGSIRGLEGLLSPMVGRDLELGQLKKALGKLSEKRQGGLVFITGEAGLGKSRLARELKYLVQPGQVQVFEGQCLTYRRSVSYWVFLDLLRNILGVTPYTPEAEVQKRLIERIQRLFGERAVEVLPPLERVMSLKPSNPVQDERLSQLEVDQLRQRILLAFRDWLAAEARRLPLLLILEDLHWADDASLDLFQFLSDSTRDEPLLIYAISRPFQEGPLQDLATRAEKRMGENFAYIRLQTLSPDQSEQLLDHLLAVLTLPVQLRNEILQRAAGNPFYLEEILRMLIDQGILQRGSGRLQIVPGADLNSLGVPETLKGLILNRFDRLDPAQRQFLQVAAAIGRQFDLSLVKVVLNLSDDQVFRLLVPRLLEREFILPVAEVPNTEYQFQHILVSDAIYSTLLSRNRTELHGQIGEAIEQVYSSRLEEQIDLLAHHYSRSNRRERALNYLILAARKAAGSFLNQQAQQYYDEALALLAEVEHTNEQEREVHSGIGDVLLFLGDYANSRGHYQAALQLTAELNLGQQVQANSNFQRKIGTTYERQGDYEQALACLNEALATLTAVSSRFPVERARVLNDIGWVYLRRGQVDEAEQYLQRALWSVEPSSQPGVVASIYNRLGGVYYINDDLNQASEYVRKSLDLRIETGDIAGVARTYNNLGILEWRRSNWDEALNDFTRSLELHAALNDIEGSLDLHCNIGLLLMDRGDLDEAYKHIDECLQTAKQIGHTYLTGTGFLYMSYYWLLQKNFDKSLEFGQQGLAFFQELSSSESLIDQYMITGQAWLGLKNTAQAEEAYQNILRLLETSRGDETGPRLQKARADRLAGKIKRQQGNFDQARQCFESCSNEFTALDNQLDLGRTLVELASLSQEIGNPVAAGSYASQARSIFSQLGAKLDLKDIENTGL